MARMGQHRKMKTHKGIKNLTPLSTSINKSIYMYDWYLPEFLLMIVEEDVVNKLVKTRRLIQEQDIETIPSKLPGKVIKLKIDEVRPYLDEDALAALQATSKYLFVRNI